MSDSENESENDAPSLDDISIEFNKKVGHFPHSVKQLLAFCKQNEYPYKFSQINSYWPNRTQKVDKPDEVPINASDFKEQGEQYVKKA